MKLTEEQKNAQLEAAGLLDPMEQQLGRFMGSFCGLTLVHPAEFRTALLFLR